jgi:hypothetical protein
VIPLPASEVTKHSIDKESLLSYLIDITNDVILKKISVKNFDNLDLNDKAYLNKKYKENKQKLADHVINSFILRSTFEDKDLMSKSLRLHLKNILQYKDYCNIEKELDCRDIEKELDYKF